jgi:uncharacterized protein (DUF427 family)
MPQKIPEWARRAQAAWRWRGAERPPFAIAPGVGEESVWDYPRPPIVVEDARHALRVLETASPPTFYLPAADVRRDRLIATPGASRCEWKGEASYWSLNGEPVAWSYPDPLPSFAALCDHFGFYPQRLACAVDGERVMPQAGGFYAGWITHEIVGPWKGESGTGGGRMRIAAVPPYAWKGI